MVTHPVTLTSVSHARVYLTGGRHAVSTNDGTWISVHGVNDIGLSEIPWQRHKHLQGTSLMLGNSAGANCYYHWMLDLLPKLGYLERAGFDLSTINYFLVRETVTPFQIESLKKFGIDSSKIIQTGKHPYLSCDEVLMVDLKHKVNMAMHQFVPEWVNSVFKYQQAERSPRHESTEKIRLYLKRPIGVRRGIENEEALEALLIEHGFEIAVMEGLSIEQQARLLGRAEIIVSPHGGALTNMVFAEAGTKVIELFGTHVYPYYYGLATLCKHEYHAILQQPEDYTNLVQLKTAMEVGTNENQAITQREEFSVDLIALGNAISAC